MKIQGRRLFTIQSLVLVSVVFLAVMVIPVISTAMTGKEIMEKQKKLLQTNDEQETIIMELIDKKGRVKKREMVRYSIKTETGTNKIIMVFTKPKDVKGTGLLTWEQKDRDDDQWLYLPALKKEKRISSSGKKNKFMGTDFAYEDLRPENLTAHEYKLIGSEEINGQDCFIIEALPSTEKEKKESGYSKRKSWIRKDIFFTVKKEYYDKKGKLRKIEESKSPKNVVGTVWRSDEILMRNIKKKHTTSVTVKNRVVNKGLKENFFTLRKLQTLK